LLNTK